MSSSRFANKVALVTGAANGIGRATCERLAREGAVVAAVDVRPDQLDTLAGAARAHDARLHTYVANALAPEQVAATVEAVHEDHGRIDILVNSVGGSTVISNPTAGVEVLTMAEWQSLIDFNLNGLFLFCKAVVPIMKAQGGGKIVNVSSLAGRGIGANSSVGYAAGKGGVNAFTRRVAVELGPFNINVNAIAPGLTLTERVKPIWDAKTDAQREAALLQIPLRRVAYAEDQAAVICFLASSDADFVTGLSIDVTGGQ